MSAAGLVENAKALFLPAMTAAHQHLAGVSVVLKMGQRGPWLVGLEAPRRCLLSCDSLVPVAPVFTSGAVMAMIPAGCTGLLAAV